MSTVCPKCGAILNEDYGMVTCPKCDSILFIDLDGVAQMGSADPAPASTHSAPADVPDFAIPETPTFDSAQAESPAFDAPSFDNDWNSAPAEEAPAPVAISFDEPTSHSDTHSDTPSTSPSEPDYFSSNEELAQPSYEPEQPPAPIIEPGPAPEDGSSEEFSMESFMNSQTGSEPAQATGAREQFSNPDDPLDLNDFANSEISQAKDGHLLFRVFVEGIDSKEIRDSLREAITDQRFAWDAQRIMSSITKGKLKIDQLPPVKAVILVNRIKRLPIQIRWEQYEITQSDDV